MTHNLNHVNIPTRKLRSRYGEHKLLVEALDALDDWEAFDEEMEVYQRWYQSHATALA
jgi:hypothetical protein